MVQAVIADMDGVVWRSDEPLPGLNDFFDFLHTRQLPYVLATNNSSKTPAQYTEKLARFGIRTTPDHIVTSAVATAVYVQKRQPGARVFVVGMPGLRETLANFGLVLADEKVDYVVAGIDWELTYATIAKANRLIRQGAVFIGTNPDLTFPTPHGPAPGAGTVLAAIEAASGQVPVVIGKPSPLMFQIALDRLDAPPAQTVMVGDRLETDILGGARAGLQTVLVCTGISTRADAEASDVQPDMIFDGLPELLRSWRAAS